MGIHAPVGLEQFLGGDGLAQDGARAQQVDAELGLRIGAVKRYMPLRISASVPAFRPGMA